MITTNKIQQLVALLLFATACVIAIIYALFAFEYLLNKSLLTDAIINGVLLFSSVAAVLFYQLKFIYYTVVQQQKLTALFQNGIRYFLAFNFFYYAFIKICGNMFSTSLATMDTPLYKLRGFELAWYFFGYSPVYNGCIILSQVICGVLLLFRRTALAACLVGFGMMLNITLINFTHHIQLKLFSVIYTLMLFYFIWLHRKTLAAAIFHAKQTIDNTPAYLNRYISKPAYSYLFFLFITLIICGFKEWKMREHFAVTTSVYGVWKLGETYDTVFTKCDKIIFDKGDEGTMKMADGEEAYFSYCVDEAAHNISIWGEPFRQDTLHYHYKRTENRALILYLSDTMKTVLKKEH